MVIHVVACRGVVMPNTSSLIWVGAQCQLLDSNGCWGHLFYLDALHSCLSVLIFWFEVFQSLAVFQCSSFDSLHTSDMLGGCPVTTLLPATEPSYDFYGETVTIKNVSMSVCFVCQPKEWIHLLCHNFNSVNIHLTRYSEIYSAMSCVNW